MAISLSQGLFTLCLALVAGICFNSFFLLSPPLLFTPFLLGIFFLTLFFRFPKMVFLGVFLLGFGIGAARHAGALEKGAFLGDLSQREVSFQGIVVKDPDAESNRTQLVVQPKGEIREKVLITTDPAEIFQVRDAIQVQGILEPPLELEDFDYPAFLAKEGISFVMAWPEIELLSRHEPLLSKLKNKFRQVLSSHVPAPESSLLGAMLLGDKSTLSQETKEVLNRSGTRHITAISGMHVSLLAGVVAAFFLSLGLWKRHALLLAILFLLFFVIFTGMQSSAIRAGIMGGAAFLGSIAGRKKASFRALVFAAAVMLLFNPLLLFHDLGFQLSFLAVLGIILFSPLLHSLLRKIPSVLGLRDVFAMTISAQIFTLPILILSFGYVSLVSLLSNVLVVPLLPVLMPLGFVFLLGGTVLSFLGILLSFPVILMLFWISFVIESSAQLPFAIVSLPPLSVLALLPLYGIALFFLWRFRQKRSPFFEGSVI